MARGCVKHRLWGRPEPKAGWELVKNRLFNQVYRRIIVKAASKPSRYESGPNPAI